MSTTELLAPEAISLRIATVRGQRVILDADLAALYEVPTKRFNEAVKCNSELRGYLHGCFCAHHDHEHPGRTVF